MKVKPMPFVFCIPPAVSPVPATWEARKRTHCELNQKQEEKKHLLFLTPTPTPPLTPPSDSYSPGVSEPGLKGGAEAGWAGRGLTEPRTK